LKAFKASQGNPVMAGAVTGFT